LFNEGDIEVPPGTKIILPTAPSRTVTLLDNKKEFSWFDIKSLAKPIDHDYETKEYLDATFDQQQLDCSVQKIIAIIRKEVELLGDTKKIFLGGFSQGCSLALATYLCFDDGPLGGVIGCSGVHCANLEWSKVSIANKK
jgi:phospholipase/carboxylesterase